MLLQTAQNDLVALAHVRPAKARDIPGAGIMPLLGRSTRGCQNQQDDEEESGHLSGPSRLAIHRRSVSKAPKPARQCISAAKQARTPPVLQLAMSWSLNQSDNPDPESFRQFPFPNGWALVGR